MYAQQQVAGKAEETEGSIFGSSGVDQTDLLDLVITGGDVRSGAPLPQGTRGDVKNSSRWPAIF